MKISIYELMGLIKDGKAPKKIKYDNKIFIWNKGRKLYEEISKRVEIISCCFFGNLNDTVEILPEENDEWEDIEEINNSADNTLFVMECYTGIPEKAQDWNFNILENKINQLIKNQKYLKEKLDGKND